MDFVIIANAWGAAECNPTSKHQIALELGRQGHRVLWIEGAGMRRPSLGSGADRRRIVSKIAKSLGGARPAGITSSGRGEIDVLSPLLLPLPSLGVVRRINGWLFRTAARHWVARLGFRDPVLVNYVPVLADVMRGWHGTVVYHCVDRWDAFDMYDSGLMRTLDACCCRYADVVIASSAALYDHARGLHGDVHLVHHGVNYEHFASALGADRGVPRPVDLPEGPVIGFFGLLSEWIDQDLIVDVARAVPEGHVVLIGPADVSIERLAALPNVRVLGARPFAELPAYATRFRVGMIPFRVNELTRAVNPIKLREMLAAGCPVVSTNLPEVARYAGGTGQEGSVSIANEAREFVRRVRELADRPLTLERQREISETVRRETWAAKTLEIVEIVRHAERRQAE